MKTKIISGLIIILLIIALISAVKAWYNEKNKPVLTKTEYVQVEKIKEIEKIKKVEVPVEKIVTIEKEVVVEKLKLPDWFADDERKQVIAVVTIPPYEGETTTVATIDTETGIGDIIAKQELLSFAGLINEKNLYGKVGFTTKKETNVTIGGQWKFVRVGKTKIGVYAEAQSYIGKDSELFAVGGLLITF
jgi:hypothetical protein